VLDALGRLLELQHVAIVRMQHLLEHLRIASPLGGRVAGELLAERADVHVREAVLRRVDVHHRRQLLDQRAVGDDVTVDDDRVVGPRTSAGQPAEHLSGKAHT